MTKSSKFAFVSDTLIQLGLFAIIVFTPWFHGTVGLWTQALAEILILCMFSLWLIKGIIQKEFQLLKTPLDLPIVALLGLCLARTVFSAYPEGSIYELNKVLSYAIIYYLSVNIITTSTRRNFFLWAVILTALSYSIYGLLQYYGYLPSSFWAQEESLASRFINSSHFAGYIALSIFLCVGMLLRKGLFGRSFSGLICALLLITLAYTRSRAAWISFLIGAMLMFFLLARFKLISGNRSFILTFFFIICMFLMVIFGRDVLITRTRELFTAEFQSAFQRFDIWRSSWNLICDRPFGVGLGAFGIIYPQYRIHSDRFFVKYAHNEALHVGAELGLLGIFILLWLVFRYYKHVLKGITFSFNRGRKRGVIFLISFIGAFTALFIHSMVDFPVRIYSVSVLFLFLLAVNMRLLFSSTYNFMKNLYKRRIIIALILTLVPFYGVSLIRIYRAELSYKRGLDLEEKFKWDRALEEYKRAASLIPKNAGYYEGLGSIYAQKAALSIEKKDYLQKAIVAYKLASENSPYDGKYHRHLALLYDDSKEKELAEQEFRMAVRLDPTSGRLRLEYGYFCLRNDMMGEAVEHLKRAQFLFHEDPRGKLDRILNECRKYGAEDDRLKELIELKKA